MSSYRPLAERMRPQRLEDYIGQNHLLGEDSPLYKAITKNKLPSMILWGPPGVGKTSLAYLIGKVTKRQCIALSAVDSGVKDVRAAIKNAQEKRFFDQASPILFVDEIHRFHKGQQDALLKAVENGTIILIGATTENPSFEVNAALLSRCQVYVLEPLSDDEMNQMIHQALEKDESLSRQDIKLESTELIIRYAAGDARKLYNVLELTLEQQEEGKNRTISDHLVQRVVNQNPTLYDKGGDFHYDTISAFIKSIRGSDPNAAVYWLARMIEGGEDPLFICRRLLILASEDIGLANPNALLMANACYNTIHQIGMPEGRIVMSQTVIYLAQSPKSNSAYIAIDKALELVRNHPNLSIPLHLRNAPTTLMKEMNYGRDYKYPHNYEQHFTKQEYLPEEIKGSILYTPANNPSENKIKESLQQYWADNYPYK